jgi:hypothetical protein
MKKFSVALGLLCLFSLSSCFFDLDTIQGDCMRGSGAMVSETRQAQDFERIHASSSINVYVSQGAGYQVRVEAEHNLLPLVRTSVIGGTLDISTKSGCFSTTRGVNVYVTMPQVRALSTSGSGNLRTENELVATELSLSVSGSGSMEVQARTPRLSARLSGSGGVVLRGQGDEQQVTVTGSGSYNARHYTTRTAQLTNTGSGASWVSVSDRLEARLTGSGSVFYRGSPHVSSQVTGSGRVVRE